MAVVRISEMRGTQAPRNVGPENSYGNKYSKDYATFKIAFSQGGCNMSYCHAETGYYYERSSFTALG
jgi:hypothetical protein